MREGFVTLYLYTPTMRYIYKNVFGEWKGTKDPTPIICYPKEDMDEKIKKIKIFKDEDMAVRWLAGEKK